MPIKTTLLAIVVILFNAYTFLYLGGHYYQIPVKTVEVLHCNNTKCYIVTEDEIGNRYDSWVLGQVAVGKTLWLSCKISDGEILRCDNESFNVGLADCAFNPEKPVIDKMLKRSKER